jgi:hypothetical protein
MVSLSKIPAAKTILITGTLLAEQLYGTYMRVPKQNHDHDPSNII